MDPVSAIGLASAVVALIEGTLKVGKEVHQKLLDYRHADGDLEDLIQCFDVTLFSARIFLDYVVGRSGALSRRDHTALLNLTSRLERLYVAIHDTLTRLAPNQSGKLSVSQKVVWTFRDKSGLKDLQAQLESWTLRASHVITALKLLDESPDQLRTLLFSSASTAQATNTMAQAFSSSPTVCFSIPMAKLSIHGQSNMPGFGMLETDTGTVNIYIEYRYLDGSLATREQIERLCVALSAADAHSMNILSCMGIATEEDAKLDRVILVYRCPTFQPASQAVHSLAYCLQNRGIVSKFPLETRFQIAVDITKAVLYTHATGWVHKSIRPENILIFHPTPKDAFSFLVGFDYSRQVDGQSDMRAETNKEKLLYQHPLRHPNETTGHNLATVRFDLRYDMYSLGVVLLSIALWRPLREMGGLASIMSGKSGWNPETVAEILKGLNAKYVHKEMGTRFQKVVECCLEDMPPQPLKDAEMLYREAFYESVLKPLMDLNV